MTLAFYVARDGLVHRTPAGVKLLLLAGLGALVFVVPTLPVAAGTLVGVVVVGLVVARLPGALLLRQARAVAVWVVATTKSALSALSKPKRYTRTSS